MWDQRYDTEEYLYGKKPNGFLVSMHARIPKGRVLCLAEGEGRNSVFLAKQGYRVFAVDSSGVGLAKARKLATENNVSIETQVVDLAHLEIEQAAWDGVVSIFCQIPSKIRKELHRKVVAGLRPDDVLVLEAYTPAQLRFKTGGPPDEDKMMTLAGLREELAGLEFVHAVELERDVIEGKLHSGRGAVVQVVGVKSEK